jgi:hypothetical protein
MVRIFGTGVAISLADEFPGSTSQKQCLPHQHAQITNQMEVLMTMREEPRADNSRNTLKTIRAELLRGNISADAYSQIVAKIKAQERSR